MRNTLGALATVVAAAALVAAASALAGTGILGASLTAKGPGNVAFGSQYAVTVSGKTGSAYPNHQTETNVVVAFEGGYTNGAAVPCYSSYSTELRAYGELRQHRQYTVRGPFTVTFRFVAAHKGVKAFCAYLLNDHGPGPNEFAFAQTNWRVA